MAAQTRTGATPDNPILFDAILRPHRSLSRAALIWVIGLVTGANLVVATLFVALGAWPVAPLCGLEVVIVVLAFQANNRAARLHERVRLTDRLVMIERVAFRQPTYRWSLSPNWLRVAVNPGPGPASQLVLSSHGRSVTLGAFLTTEEKLDFARSLQEALLRWRRGGAG